MSGKNFLHKMMLLVVVTVSVCGLAGCQKKSDVSTDQKDKKTIIITTTGMVADIVRHVAGEHAEVIGLMAEGVDPHSYTPTTKDILMLSQADVIFYSGLLLEGHMQENFESLKSSGKPVFAITDCLDDSFLRNPSGLEGHPDPHVWMDVSAWSQCVAEVARQLSEYDKAHASEYQKNAEAYQAELKKLDEYIKKIVKTIPEKQRNLVTAHDAFGYFARSYGISVRSVQGITTESEPSISDINNLVDFIVKNKVPAIFVESSVSKTRIKAIQEGVLSKGGKIELGGSLFSDAMGAAETYEGTYIGMLDHNATLIVLALGGKAPAKGMQGKLALDKIE